ncbi:chemotaxis protein [Vibrio albus]|uniref:Chemotaxis protein n=1 Tax=Vibrio albus TaxID=2200953 RepID=A0A2U3B776_9VIBR|nr:methyl-accepting chemotaxis protein [Vibrio albus]PWI32640.1 chemotaxis protein [Vibrio albus]
MNFTIKTRLYTLAIVPILIIAISMMFFTYSELQELNAIHVTSSQQRLMQTKQDELKSYLQIAESAIADLKNNQASREVVIERLKPIKFGENGYLFGYDSKGVRHLLGSSDKGIGENFWNLQDTTQAYIIQDIVKQAKRGDGFTTYYFPKPGETESSPKLSYSVYLPEWDLILGTGFYIDSVDKMIAQMEATATQQAKESVTSIALISFVIVILAGILAIIINQSIIRPLKTFDRSIASFASGDADLTARMENYNIPEFAMLSQNFNTFVASLQSIIKSVSDVSTEVSDETHNMAGRASQVSQLIEAEKQESEQVATAMTEMTSTAGEISNNANQAASAAKEAEDTTAEATEIFISANVSVQALAADVAKANEVISELEGNVQNISSSLLVIQDIAEQTNLLALNAAIEAARAGEQGRGFAVVADEVRKLASRTQESTQDIQQVIEQLKSASDAAVKTMETGQNRSTETVDKTELARAALDKIQSSINVIMDMNSLIATATEEQTQVGSDISQRIEFISEQSRQTSDIAAQNQAGGENLSRKARSLAELVDRFTV